MDDLVKTSGVLTCYYYRNSPNRSQSSSLFPYLDDHRFIIYALPLRAWGRHWRETRWTPRTRNTSHLYLLINFNLLDRKVWATTRTTTYCYQFSSHLVTSMNPNYVDGESAHSHAKPVNIMIHIPYVFECANSQKSIEFRKERKS